MHGFDLGKRNASDMFYLPCQPADKGDRICKDYKGENREVLDPKVWLADEPAPMTIAGTAARWPPTAREVERLQVYVDGVRKFATGLAAVDQGAAAKALIRNADLWGLI